MNKLFAATVASLGFYTFANAAETSLDGFQQTKWGMSEQQVNTVYGGTLTHWTVRIGGWAFRHFGIKNYDVDGCDMSVSFEFGGGELSRVKLNLKHQTQLGCARKIADTLIAKYGPPTNAEPANTSSSEGKIITWFLGSTKIKHFSFFYPQSGRSLFFIYYEPTRTRGAGKL